jgi:ATPase subunit of ABC transporter with duplicated ATPase domains
MKEFAGTILFHSHDQEVMNSIANRIIEITPKGLVDKHMSYEEYAESAEIKVRRAELYA